MIKFSLKCSNGHAFESWFQDNDGFEALRTSGHLSCPVCGDATISKALMAPSVSTARRKEDRTVPADPVSAPPPVGGPGEAPTAPAQATSPRYMTTPEAVRREFEGRLRALRAQVEANADYVGREFADEARRIHEGEAEERAIYGETSAEEAEALHEDGVPVTPIPWIDRRDD
ncbi:MAG: DUF1178 family protein [Pseudomonadota bacterium]